MRRITLSLFILFCIIACQKEISFGDGDGTTPTGTVRCTSCSYLPVCDSTQLTYIDSTAAGLDTTKSILTLLGDTTIGGRKFNRVSPYAVFRQGLLYNCDGGEYRIYQAVPNLGLNIDSVLQSLGLPGNVTLPSKIQTTILKANAAAGATWSDTVFTYAPVPFLSIAAKLDYKIEEKGVQRIVSGKTFTNVIHVSGTLNIAIPLMPLPFDFKIDYYFAEGIGIIETRTVSNGAVQAVTKLYQYKIK